VDFALGFGINNFFFVKNIGGWCDNQKKPPSNLREKISALIEAKKIERTNLNAEKQQRFTNLEMLAEPA